MLKRQNGYTLVELTLAMAVFGFMLMIALGGFLNIIHIHRAAAAARNTQQNSRALIEEVIRNVRGGRIATVGTNPVGSTLCLVGSSSTVVFYLRSQAGVNSFWEDSINDAGPNACASVAASSRQLSSTDVAVIDFEPTITPPALANGPTSVQVEFRIASDISLLAGTGKACDPALPGAEFCSVTVMRSMAELQGGI